MAKKNKINYIISSILLVLFIVVVILVLTNNTKTFDESIYNFLYSLRSTGMDLFMKTITQFGNTIPVIIITLLIMILLPKKKDMFLVGFNTIITVSSNQILKHIICRPRPSHLRLISEGGYSFPSGHAMISICLYGLLIYLVNKFIKNKILKILLTVLLMLIIICIGLSRIYVGVHYPSDILGGYLLSLAILITNIPLVNKYYRGKNYEKGGNL